jgi:hypothetical protein
MHNTWLSWPKGVSGLRTTRQQRSVVSEYFGKLIQGLEANLRLWPSASSQSCHERRQREPCEDQVKVQSSIRRYTHRFKNKPTLVHQDLDHNSIPARLVVQAEESLVPQGTHQWLNVRRKDASLTTGD